MITLLLLFFLVAVLFLIVAIGIFNRLVRARNQEREGWSGIDVQLRKRHDLVPLLVETVRAYKNHEQSVLEAVTASRGRAAGTPGRTDAAEEDLSKHLQKLLAVVEAYPDLKSDKNFQQLSTELVAIEDALQYARRYYNGSVRDFRNLAESFPSNVVASIFSFCPASFFEVESATERSAPRVAI